MNKITLIAVLIFASFAAIAEEPAGIVQSASPAIQAAPERVYTATEFEAVKQEAAKWKAEFDALLLLHQQQITAIFQVALSRDLESVKELIRQIQIMGMVGGGKRNESQ